MEKPLESKLSPNWGRILKICDRPEYARFKNMFQELCEEYALEVLIAHKNEIEEISNRSVYDIAGVLDQISEPETTNDIARTLVEFIRLGKIRGVALKKDTSKRNALIFLIGMFLLTIGLLSFNFAYLGGGQ
jgi:hypothetical protein